MKNPVQVLASLSTFVVLGSAFRAHADPPPRSPPSPPSEAIAACENASEGDACTVTFRNHEMHGTCAAFTEGKLACRPDKPPLPPRD